MKIDNNSPANLNMSLLALENFGFSGHQARIYVELLRIGPTTAGPLVKRCRMHRQFVYSALEILHEKGFVSYALRNNRKVFSASRPESLLQYELERARQMQLVIPVLQQLVPKGSDQFHVEVLTGRDEFIRRLYTLVDSAARCDGMIRGIAGARDVDIYATIGAEYKNYIEYSQKKKVRKQLIAPAVSATKGYKERLSKEKGAELRTIESQISTPTATLITKEVVAIDLFASEVVSIMIWNRTIASGFLDNFALLWKSAKKYPRF